MLTKDTKREVLSSRWHNMERTTVQVPVGMHLVTYCLFSGASWVCTVEKSAQTGIEETAHPQDILKEITSFIPEFTTPRQNTSTFSLH